MYGVGGERRLTEFRSTSYLATRARDPRGWNAASEQFQLDVYGEIATAIQMGMELGLEARAWERRLATVEYVESIWTEPDDGIWEVRGPRRHFTSSKVLAWVVFDRSFRMADRAGLEAPLARWSRSALRFTETCAKTDMTPSAERSPSLLAELDERPEHSSPGIPSRDDERVMTPSKPSNTASAAMV